MVFCFMQIGNGELEEVELTDRYGTFINKSNLFNNLQTVRAKKANIMYTFFPRLSSNSSCCSSVVVPVPSSSLHDTNSPKGGQAVEATAL